MPDDFQSKLAAFRAQQTSDDFQSKLAAFRAQQRPASDASFETLRTMPLTPAPAVSTAVGPTTGPAPRGIVDYAKSFGTGAIMGATGIDTYDPQEAGERVGNVFDLISGIAPKVADIGARPQLRGLGEAAGQKLAETATPYQDDLLHKAGQFAGMVAPYIPISGGVGLAAKVPAITRLATKIPGAIRGTAGGVARAAGVGALGGAYFQGSRAAQGLGFDPAAIGLEAGIFGAADVGLRGAGKVVSRLLKRKGVRDAIQKRGAEKVPARQAPEGRKAVGEAYAERPEVAGAKEKVKQPWEMTRGEWVKTDEYLLHGTPRKNIENLRPGVFFVRTSEEGIARGYTRHGHYTEIPQTGEVHVVYRPGGMKSKDYITRGPYLQSEKGIKVITVGRVSSKKSVHEQLVERALSEGKPVPASVLKDYPELTKKAAPKAKPGGVTTLGFMGVHPEAVKKLGQTAKSITKSTQEMIEKAKVKPEIRTGVKEAKTVMIEHDRQIRRSESTSALLKKITSDAVPKPDRQMLMVHAYEQKMKGKFWKQLTSDERGMVKFFSGEKAKLNQFIKDNKILETMESENINHIFHHWIDPVTGKPFKAMYGKFSKGLPQAKQRKIPTYEAGIKAGLKPATTNLGELIGLEWQAAMRAHQSRQMFKTLHNIGAEKGASIKLTVAGKPRPIRMIERWDKLQRQGLTDNYTRYSHYALDESMVFRDAAGKTVMLKGPVGVRTELYPFVQAYMENPTYNAFDNLISVSRSAKLGLSMFHAVSLAAQEAALSIGKLVTGHPVQFARRIPFTAIPRGLKYRKELGPVERLLYQEGLELYKHSEQMGRETFFRGVGIPGKAANIITAPVKLGRDFIFGVVQPGMKTAFAHDTFLSMLPKYLKGTGWTKETVIAAFEAGKTIPKEALKAARQAVQMADGHFSGEHWRRSLLETNRFMVKAYFSPGAQTAWNRGLLSKTWQREHLLVAKNVAKSFMPDKLISKMGLAEIHPAAKAEYRQYAYGAVAIVGAVDVWNLMSTEMMDGKAKHLWENPPGKGFAVRAPWNEPNYTVTDKNGKTRTIKGGAAYIRPLKSLFEVAEWVHHPFRKFSYKLAPYLSAIIAQFPNNKYRNYEGMKDVPKRAMDFMFDTFEPIVIDQLVDVARGRKKWPAAVSPFLGMPTSKVKRTESLVGRETRRTRRPVRRRK